MGTWREGVTVTFFKDVTKARRRITNKARECEREWKLKNYTV